MTGRTPTLVDPNGYITPMEIHDGLAYLHIRLPTDSEWKSMPRISFTTDAEWKPKRLDATIPDDWYERQDRFNLYLRDSQFTEDGQLKESVLHAEAPDDMPERDDKEASRVDRDTIRCYLHNQIRHDIDDIFVYNVVGRDIYEHRLTASERREVDQLRSPELRHVHDAHTRPRRSTAKYSSPSGPLPSRQPHRSGGQSSRQPKNSTTKATETRDPPPIQTTDEFVDDLQAPTDMPDDYEGYNNPAKKVDASHPSVSGEPRYKGLLGPGLKGDFGPRMIKPSKINYDLYVRHFPGFPLDAIKRTFLATT